MIIRRKQNSTFCIQLLSALRRHLFERVHVDVKFELLVEYAETWRVDVWTRISQAVCLVIPDYMLLVRHHTRSIVYLQAHVRHALVKVRPLQHTPKNDR